jgi:glycerate kinase
MSTAPLILLAPDSFKGTFPAAAVAEALADGVASAGARPDRCPVADGGEGTMEVLVAAVGGSVHAARVHDPLGRAHDGRFALLSGSTAVVETAQASGLALVAEDERDPEAALANCSWRQRRPAPDASCWRLGEVPRRTAGWARSRPSGPPAASAMRRW